MIALIQRVSHADVKIKTQVSGQIGKGLLVLLGIEAEDDEVKLKRLVHKVLGYRVFPDEQDRMNLNVVDAGGQLLIVSQFTLAAETKKGMRPGFSCAATPDKAERLYEQFIMACKSENIITECGQFGADMQVSLTNDGPVTFWLQV